MAYSSSAAVQHRVHRRHLSQARWRGSEQPSQCHNALKTIVTTIIYQKQRVISQQSKPGPYNSSLATARFTSTQQSTLAGSTPLKMQQQAVGRLPWCCQHQHHVINTLYTSCQQRDVSHWQQRRLCQVFVCTTGKPHSHGRSQWPEQPATSTRHTR